MVSLVSSSEFVFGLRHEVYLLVPLLRFMGWPLARLNLNIGSDPIGDLHSPNVWNAKELDGRLSFKRPGLPWRSAMEYLSGCGIWGGQNQGMTSKTWSQRKH